jgi:hypothetical protein
VVIRSSTARDVQNLIAELRQPDTLRREAAIARLRVVGARAVTRLSALVEQDDDALARSAGLKALDGIDDPRVADAAIAALRDLEPNVRRVAVLVLRGWILREDGTRILDALAAVALDRAQDAAVRDAARDALELLPRDIVQPLLEHALPAAGGEPTLDDPASLAEWLRERGAQAPLSALHALVVRAGEREAAEAHAGLRAEWQAARGAVHLALARRGSTVALYNLRETFAGAAMPLPIDFLTAAAAVGDASCLEPMAQAWSAVDDRWWREHLAQTAAAIARRVKLTGRSAAMKRIKGKWPGFLK